MWIEGQNAIGKTILVKKLLGATFPLKPFAPLDIMKNPLDIEKDFPERLVPSDFVFNYDIILPEHITFIIGGSQIHIFLEKVRGNAKKCGNAKERNKIFKLYKEFLTQNDVIKEREHHIKELEDRIKSRLDQCRDEFHQYETTKKELEEKIAKIDEISTKIDKLLDVPEFKRYHELLSDFIESKFTKKEPKSVYELLWDKVKQYEKMHDEIVLPLYKNEEVLFNEKKSIGNHFDLTKKLEEHKTHPPGVPFTSSMNFNLETLRKNLEKYKNKLITKADILTLIRNFPSEKKVWIDGKPSLQFEDFYILIELINKLSPEELFISHCGDKMWFQQAFKTAQHTQRGDLILDLNGFKKVYIEAPSMDKKVTLNKG